MSYRLIQEIYQYIQCNGNFLSSEKVLKEVQKHPQIIWEVIVRLCSKLKNKNIQIAYSHLSFMLDHPQKHKISVKWLLQFMIVKDIAVKLGTSYTIKDYFRPQKQKTINFMAKVIQVTKGVNKMKEQMDKQITQQQILTLQLMRVKNQHDKLAKQLEQNKQRKKNELPLYLQKIKKNQELAKQITSKRQQKFNLLALKKSLQQQLYKKQKKLKMLRFNREDKQEDIQKLKQKLTQNAPELQREQRKIQQQLGNVQKQCKRKIQKIKRKNGFIFDKINIKKREFENLQYRLRKFQSIYEIVKPLTEMKQNQIKKIQQMRKTKNRLILHQFQLRDQKCKTQMESYRRNIKLENTRTQRQKVMKVRNEAFINKQQIKYQNSLFLQKKLAIQAYSKQVQQQIQEIQKFYQAKTIQLKQKNKKWNDLLIQKVQEVHLSDEIKHYVAMIRPLNVSSKQK